MTASSMFRCTERSMSKGMAARTRTRTVKVHAARRFDVKLRPYTLRSGDTLQSIAKKRGLSVEQLVSLNLDIKPDRVTEGTTILLPGDRLSTRDKEIVDAIGIGATYRFYPVRKGENVADISGKRKISMEQMKELNPGINLEDMAEGQVLRLPADKFTVREREMLMGTGILPPEFFQVTRNPFFVGIGGLLLVCGFVMAWQRFYREEDVDED